MSVYRNRETQEVMLPEEVGESLEDLRFYAKECGFHIENLQPMFVDGLYKEMITIVREFDVLDEEPDN